MNTELLNNEEKLSTLSARLVYAINALGITQAELARRIGVKPQAIHYLCNSNSKKSRFTYEIADALQINSLWLGSGEGSMKFKEDPNTQLISSQKRTPVLNWKQIKQLTGEAKEVSNILSSAKEWILTSSDIGENGFAFRLHDKSIYPRFDQDTIIIVNPKRSPKNRDFVIVYLKETDDIIFRQYEFDSTTILLKPINVTMYKVIEKQKDDVILGVMVEARWQV